MKAKKALYISLLLCVNMINAQVTEPKVLTLSNGKYPEFQEDDTLMRVGSVVINLFTGKIYETLEYDSLYNESNLEPTVISRFYSLDPLATKYPDLSPYAFVANNPILFTDGDGQEIIIKDPSSNKTIIYKPNDASIKEGASEFVLKTIEGLDYLYNNGIQNGINRVDKMVKDQENKVTFIETKSHNSNKFISEELVGDMGLSNLVDEGSILFWNPSSAAEIPTGVQSPLVGLAHELDHGFKFFKLYSIYRNAAEGAASDDAWANLIAFTSKASPETPEVKAEENRVTKGWETFISNKLGQATRADYSINPSRFFNVDKITGTEEKIEFIRLPTKKASEMRIESPTEGQ